MKTILAIDPGPEQSALVIWHGDKIGFADKMPNVHAVNYLRCIQPGLVVCERVESYGMPVGREVFETCFWTGRFWQIVAGCGCFHLVPRREVKMHLCGQARAKDSNIRQALIDRFGPPGTKKAQGLTYGLKADLWQAFALAVTFGDLPGMSEKYKA